MLDKLVSPQLILIVVIVGSFIGAAVGSLIDKYGLRRIIPFATLNAISRPNCGFESTERRSCWLLHGFRLQEFLFRSFASMENYDTSLFGVIILAAKKIKGTTLDYFISFFLQYSGLHF
ncbi:MAG: hypothetical protein ACXV5P_09875 [Halobacteriota archaeon]